ncbi:MAG: hypothetical protein IT580_15140, partial [Verrucomicrobiales bacterium]|nr:hypothetical protein [Verrucomicrobiales bacterium]
RDNQTTLSEADRSRIVPVLDAVKAALQGTDIAALKAAGTKLNDTWQSVSTALYRTAAERDQAGPSPGTPPPRSPRPNEPDRSTSSHAEEESIINAEIVEDHRAG